MVNFMNIMIPVIAFVGCLLTGKLLERFSRKNMLFYGDIICSFMLLTMGYNISSLDQNGDS